MDRPIVKNGDGESDGNEVNSLGSNPHVANVNTDTFLSEVALGDYVSSSTASLGSVPVSGVGPRIKTFLSERLLPSLLFNSNPHSPALRTPTLAPHAHPP